MLRRPEGVTVLRARHVFKAVAVCGLASGILAACDEASGASAESPPHQSAVGAEPGAGAPELAGPDLPRPSEIDRNALEMARRACANSDFNEFFTAMAISSAVRQKYSAPMIEVATLDGRGNVISTRQVPSGSYGDFPVTQVDFYYKPTRPLRAGDEGEYLDLQFNQSQNDDYSVEWARVHYDGQSDGGDDLGNILGTDGKALPAGTHPEADGQLLFHPTQDCWRLQEDIRWRR